MTQGICRMCGEAVELLRLTFAKESNIKESTEGEWGASLLCAEHPAKEGCRTTSIVGQTTGAVHKVICDGSFRPSKQFVH